LKFAIENTPPEILLRQIFRHSMTKMRNQETRQFKTEHVPYLVDSQLQMSKALIKYKNIERCM
jgi:hypothetical protein